MRAVNHITDLKELEAFRDFCKAHIPQFIRFYHLLKFHLENLLPLLEFNFYKKSTESATYYYAFIKERPNIFDKEYKFDHWAVTECVGLFNAQDFLEGWQALCPSSGEFPDLVVTRKIFTDAIATLYDNLDNFKVCHYPCASFYMNEEQRERLLKWEEPKEFLAQNGYTMTEADPERDTEIIHKRWLHGRPGFEMDTKVRLKYMPTVCLWHNKDELVSHEMMSFVGQLTHQFTVEEHRRKGLGTIVERVIAKKVALIGMIPCKEVEHYNKTVYERSVTDKFWTLLRKDNGEEDAIVYMPIIKIK